MVNTFNGMSNRVSYAENSTTSVIHGLEEAITNMEVLKGATDSTEIFINSEDKQNLMTSLNELITACSNYISKHQSG